MLQTANIAYKNGEYETAHKLFSVLAEQGNADAQTSLGYMYQNAQGCEVNEAKTLELYTKAAEQKQPFALFNLAILYENGMGGVAHDMFKAYDLHMAAAEREVPPAQYEVGLMLERGLGCVQSYSEAAFWYEEAAKRGHLEAFNNLGVLYKDGLGVVQDDDKCFICFNRAAEGDLAQGLYNLGLLYDQGVGCETDNDKALDLCRKAAYKGHEKAKEIIKGLQEDGKIVF